MTTTRFFNRESFAFMLEGKIIPYVDLVVVEGMFDAEKQSYVDEPRVTSGYGTVRPARVAELVGIPMLAERERRGKL